MSSPFSEQMRQTLSRIETTLTPSGPGPVSETSPISGGESAPRNFSVPSIKNINLQTFKNPIVAFPTGVLLFYLLLLALRGKIWKDKEKRPRAMKLFLYVVLLSVPIFFWIFMRK